MKYEYTDNIKSLIKIITNALLKIFSKAYGADRDALMTLSQFNNDAKKYLKEHTDLNSPFGIWASNNFKEFMDKSLIFAKENNEQLVALMKDRKYGEVHDLIQKNIAKDLGFSMKSREMPDEVKSDPNRRISKHVDKVTLTLKEVSELAGNELYSEMAELLSSEIESKLSKPQLSQYEMEIGKSFELERKKERVRNHDYEPTRSNESEYEV